MFQMLTGGHVRNVERSPHRPARSSAWAWAAGVGGHAAFDAVHSLWGTAEVKGYVWWTGENSIDARHPQARLLKKASGREHTSLAECFT